MKRTVDPIELLAESGLAELEAKISGQQVELKQEQEKLLRLTFEDNKRRARGPSVSRATDLDTALQLQAQDDQLARDLVATNEKIIGLFRGLNESRDRRVSILAELDKQIRPLLLAEKQANISRVAELCMALADALLVDRIANTEAESLLMRAGLQPAQLENVLGGIAGRLIGDDRQAAPFDDIAKEWRQREWLVGPVARQTEERARSAFDQRERAATERHQRELAIEEQARLDRLAWQRARIASGEATMTVRMDNGSYRPISPAEALERFDRQHSGEPIPRPQPTLSGELVGA